MKAIAKLPLTFQDLEGNTVSIEIGTEFYLDLTEMIGFYNNCHFEVFEGEFLLWA